MGCTIRQNGCGKRGLATTVREKLRQKGGYSSVASGARAERHRSSSAGAMTCGRVVGEAMLGGRLAVVALAVVTSLQPDGRCA